MIRKDNRITMITNQNNQAIKSILKIKVQTKIAEIINSILELI
jgi:hypothetical protein